jgi:hypothetical protein
VSSFPENSKYASDQYELIAMDLIDAIAGHKLRKSGEAGGVGVSEYLFMCLELFKRDNGGMGADQTLSAILDLPLATMRDYERADWRIFTKEEWLGAFIDGELEYFEVEAPGQSR